jgi:TRAP transporter TAXI family solute receptor
MAADSVGGWLRRGTLGAWVALLSATLVVGTAWGQELRYLHVGTGPPGESHFPMGGLIAGAISNPPGSPPCERGGNCGVPGLIAVATVTNGSSTNAEAIGDGRLEAALAQSDVAMWAYQGAPPFEGRAVKSLRSVAQLYPDQLHVVVRRDSKIKTIRELRGKRVSLGERGSGTLIHAKQVLAAWGIKESEVKPVYLRSAVAADAMAAGKLDALFVVDGAPVPSVAELAKAVPIALLPLTGDGAATLRRNDPLLSLTDIPGSTYDGVAEPVPTLALGVSLIVSASLPDDLVYGMCKALWQPGTLRMLAEGQPQGAGVTLTNALTGIGVPLHPGAQKFYLDKGMIE